jgi:hypothetical protein
MTSSYRTPKLPRDPDGQNDNHAEWARCAIAHFQIVTGADWDDAVADLLCDLMHLCDREAKADGETVFDFNTELARARRHYEAETGDGSGWPVSLLLAPDVLACHAPLRWCRRIRERLSAAPTRGCNCPHHHMRRASARSSAPTTKV